MKVQFLGHSGFLLHAEGKFLLFDFFTDESGALARSIPKGAEGVVLISHRHADHCNPAVFDMAKDFDASFIVDSGVEARKGLKKVFKAFPGSFHDLGWATVKAYGSTDEGCSFLVRVGSASMFHAGDLNDWYWEEESTPEELERDEARFMEEISKIEEKGMDVAFLPFDMRLGKHAARGLMKFATLINPKLIIPMHFNGTPNPQILHDTLKENGIKSDLALMQSPGEELEL